MTDAKGWHHAYFGSALMLAGFLGIVFTDSAPWLCESAVTVGVVVFVDDLRQHLIQRTDPEYRSPLNRLYSRTLWRVEWIRKVNEWADRIFGRKV